MKLTINGIEVEAAAGSTILEAATAAGIKIPTLCYLKSINKIGACRVCLVEIQGARAPMAACVTAAAEGMVVETDTPTLKASRKKNLELICADHRMDCTECERGMNCELRDLCRDYGVDDHAFGVGSRERLIDASGACIVRDNSRCILCRRCVSTCKSVQGVCAVSANLKGAKTNVGFGVKLSETDCVGCGQCVASCPTGALTEKDDTKKAWKLLLAKNRKKAAALVSPFVCRQIGELLGEEMGADCTGKLAAALHRMGFDEIYLTGLSVTACPAWRKYLEKKHPELVSRLPDDGGTPWERMGRAYKAQNPDTSVTAFSPCVASKAFTGEGIDAALTTKELAAMWRRACVSSFTALEVWKTLPDEQFDVFPLDEPAVLVEAEGLAEAERLIAENALKSLSVLACPGGCACGGGAPNVAGSVLSSINAGLLRQPD